MMRLLIAFTLFSILLFTGCTTKEVITVHPTCPYIQPLAVVPHVEGNISNGVTPEQLKEILRTAYMLRKSETYYNTQIIKYNKKYSTALDNN